MSFPIAVLAPGENRLCALGRPEETYLSVRSDRVDVATLETQEGRQRYRINGVPESWRVRVENIEFSPFPSYHYDFVEEAGSGFVINGAVHPGMAPLALNRATGSCRCWDVARGDIPLWSCMTDSGPQSFLGEEQTRYPLYAPVQVLPNQQEFLYEAAIPGPEYQYFLMRGNDVAFRGKVYDVQVHTELPQFSWVGIDAENRAMIHLRGAVTSFGVDRNAFAPSSFAVNDAHTRFLVGVLAENGTLQPHLDGRPTGCVVPADGLYDADFSPDGRSYYFASDSDAGATALIWNNRPVDLAGEAYDFHLREDALWYVAVDGTSHSLVVNAQGRPHALAAWPRIQYQSLALSPNGRHHACIVQEPGAPGGSWAFVLDNVPVWRFDDVFRRSAAYYEGDGHPVRFLDDGRAICVGIKGDEVLLFAAEA